MQRMWKKLGWLGVFVLVVVGCKPTETRIQPPPLREEYKLPPDDDARFSAPPSFPREARNSGPKARISDGPTQMPPSLRNQGGARGGAGAGPGGY